MDNVIGIYEFEYDCIHTYHIFLGIGTYKYTDTDSIDIG